MDDSDIETILDNAQRLFEQHGEVFEEGLDVDDSALLQLRKACRLIDSARFLRDNGGYYTMVVEASFSAIERTVQFYLLDKGMLHEDEYIEHEKVYRKGKDAGLYSQEFCDKLISLWKNNRSETYYREGVATEKRAEKMLELAEAIHEHVLQLSGSKHECLNLDKKKGEWD